MYLFSGQFGSSIYDSSGENKDVDFLVVPFNDISTIPEPYRLHRKFSDGSEVLRTFNNYEKPFTDVVRVCKTTLEEFLKYPARVSVETRNAINSVLLYGIIFEGMKTVQKKLKATFGQDYTRKLLKLYLIDQGMTDIDGFPEKLTPHEAVKRLMRFSWIIKKWDTYELLKNKKTELTNPNSVQPSFFEIQKILRILLEVSVNRLHLDGLDYI